MQGRRGGAVSDVVGRGGERRGGAGRTEVEPEWLALEGHALCPESLAGGGASLVVQAQRKQLR